MEDEGRGDRDRLRGVRWLRRLPLSLCTTINYIVIVLCIAFAMCQPNGKRNSVEERRKERESERREREKREIQECVYIGPGGCAHTVIHQKYTTTRRQMLLRRPLLLMSCRVESVWKESPSTVSRRHIALRPAPRQHTIHTIHEYPPFNDNEI